jgi:coproporphyrinogen III oxidase
MAGTPPLHERAERYFRELQSAICRGLEEADGGAAFGEDLWDHAGGSGGGATRVIAGGAVLEKGGVNFSSVRSMLSPALAGRMNVPPQEVFATGISLVLHPASPMIPTVHMNLRHLRLASGDAWFGGGADLTPWYLFEEDARHFHATLRAACDAHPCASYGEYKRWCDEYFTIKHRGETRGIGGVFFDYRRDDPEAFFAFVRELGDAFLPAYLPIVERRKAEPWGAPEKRWQLLRRGRYVEFNLVYDRGTLFGLETNGRTESILMSLPPDASWEYNHAPAAGSREADLLRALRQPRTWT